MSMPREIFEYPPSLEERILQDSHIHIPLQVERIDIEKGIWVYVKGHTFPQKGIATPEAIWAINHVKRLTKEFLRHPWLLVLLGRKNAVRALERVLWHGMAPYIIKQEFLTPCAREVGKLLRPLCGEKVATMLAHVIEYDQAYRFRLQDLCTETSKKFLLKEPITEIRYLLYVNRKRDYKEVAIKIAMVGEILTLLLLIPWYRNKFKKVIAASDFTQLQFDTSDRYWASLKKDYNYFGICKQK